MSEKKHRITVTRRELETIMDGLGAFIDNLEGLPSRELKVERAKVLLSKFDRKVWTLKRR